MADSGSLQSLLSTKAALDLGLISQTDFDAVKGAFLRAQQIKAAQDVGLIRPEDYEDTKREYLDSLLAAGGAPSVSAPSAAQAPPPAEPPAAAAPPSPRPAPVAWSVPMASAPAPVPAAPQRAAAAAPPRQQQPPAVAPPAPTPAAPAPTPLPRVASNPSVPSNIPKMGGIKAVGNGTSMSGISVTEDAVNLFYLMRLKATYKWALWQVDESGTAVIIAAVGDKNSTWQDFLAALPDADCRYGVYDFDFQTPDGQKLHKMIFLNWAPDSARVKAKMMYASTKDFFKSHLDGLSLEFQASDLDEVSEQEVGDAVRALKRG